MFLTAIIFLVILSLLVLIHELGHFLVARYFGVDVEEFGLGLPPRIFGKKLRGTIYSINFLPIGGFVKLAGEDDEEQQKKSGKIFFWQKSKKQRAAILGAGVFMNFFLAIGITTYLLTQGVMEPTGRVHVERVISGGPAEVAGIIKDDIIAAVGWGEGDAYKQELIRTPQTLIDVVKAHSGEKVQFVVVRREDMMRMYVTPRKEYPQGEGPTGIAISDFEKKTYPISVAPIKSLEINLTRARDMLVSLGETVWKLVTFQKLTAEVAGPIGIAQVTGEAVKFGFMAVLEFMSILSLNLAVLNVLPIPALDGGRLAFVFMEKILGRKIRPAFEKSTHQIGMIILFALILLVSINDILRLARG